MVTMKRIAGIGALCMALAAFPTAARADAEKPMVEKLAEVHNYAGCGARTSQQECERTMFDGIECAWKCNGGSCSCEEGNPSKLLQTIAKSYAKNKAAMKKRHLLSEDESANTAFHEEQEEILKNPLSFLFSKRNGTEKEPPEKEAESSKTVSKETCFTLSSTLTKAFVFVAETVFEQVLNLT